MLGEKQSLERYVWGETLGKARLWKTNQGKVISTNEGPLCFLVHNQTAVDMVVHLSLQSFIDLYTSRLITR